jgi:hypothetical protein
VLRELLAASDRALCGDGAALFLIAAGTLAVLGDAARLVLPLVLMGTGIAFLLELLQLRREAGGGAPGVS